MKSMTVTYEVDESLYVNMTNRCTNNCDFCIRKNGDGAYGSDPLWLEHEPSLAETEASLFSRDLSKYREIVFCGYGEPSYRLADITLIIKKMRLRYPGIKTRINTNGQSDLIYGTDTAPYFDIFDTVSISLNAPNADDYAKLCHPIYGKEAFGAILKFASEVKKYSPSVVFSVVDTFMTEEEIAECRKIADAAGIHLRIRAYIPSDSK